MIEKAVLMLFMTGPVLTLGVDSGKCKFPEQHFNTLDAIVFAFWQSNSNARFSKCYNA